MEKQAQASMRMNEKKFQCGYDKMVFLGYDVSTGSFCFSMYVKEQKGKLSRSEILRILVVFNVS